MMRDNAVARVLTLTAMAVFCGLSPGTSLRFCPSSHRCTPWDAVAMIATSTMSRIPGGRNPPASENRVGKASKGSHNMARGVALSNSNGIRHGGNALEDAGCGEPRRYIIQAVHRAHNTI